jgi:hydroxymethylglutaryl-CoA synthase
VPAILSYGVYVPYYRLDRALISEGLESGGGSPGTRSVASYDEDPTSMAVEAAMAALDREGLPEPEEVLFSTASAPYLDKTNATTIRAALGLSTNGLALDLGGAVRSGVGALLAASRSPHPSLAVLSDIRTGLPGSPEERDGGDASCAFLFGEGDGIASLIGSAHTSDEFLDVWRIPGEDRVRHWEERFGEHLYVPLAEQAFAQALEQTGLKADEIDHLVVTGVSSRSARILKSSLGVRPDVVTDDLARQVGNAGTAHLGLLLASALDVARPGETIAVVVVADGASVLVFRASDHVEALEPRRTVEDELASGRGRVSYNRFLTWRGHLRREPPRRPDPVPPSAPPSHRNEGWKFAFTGSRCRACGNRQLPPARACVACGTIDETEPVRLAKVPATIVTYTADRLAYSPNPPLIMAVIDFDGGGRYRCELTDCDPSSVAIGGRVEMTFRRVNTSGGIHNYAWKARPVRTGES